MSDLRVNTTAIADTYLTNKANKELWSVSPVWQPQAAKDVRIITPDNAPKGVRRVVDGVIKVFEAKTSVQHRAAIDIFERDLLWDGPPIRISNKGHLRLATYLFKYFAHLNIIPTTIYLSEPKPGHHLIELDAVAVSHPHRVWFIPATLLLPSDVAKNVHFKIGVKGSLEDGLVELFTGRLTNWPPFAPLPVRTLNGIVMGALPHAFENVLGYAFDVFDGGHYYAQKRDTLFKQRHPDSSNPWWDWAQDLAKDIPNWGKEQSVVAFETAQALFGKTFDNMNAAVQQVVNFYMWLFSSIWAAVQNIIGTVQDFIGGASESVPTSYNGTAQAPGGTTGTATGAGAKYYKPQMTTAPPVTARPAVTATTGKY